MAREQIYIIIKQNGTTSIGFRTFFPFSVGYKMQRIGYDKCRVFKCDVDYEDSFIGIKIYGSEFEFEYPNIYKKIISERKIYILPTEQMLGELSPILAQQIRNAIKEQKLAIKRRVETKKRRSQKTVLPNWMLAIYKKYDNLAVLKLKWDNYEKRFGKKKIVDVIGNYTKEQVNVDGKLMYIVKVPKC